jgi:FMN-dependent NADH-azoreductase
MKLLHIDSSITGGGSVTRQITASIVAHLKRETSALEISYRDLAADPVPHQSLALLSAKAPSVGEHSSEVQHALAATEAALDEFLSADVVVIGAPMYNFGISSQLKTWIDALAVAGRTYSYTEMGPEGLCGAKRLIIASSRGGVYSAPSPMASLDHQEAYLSGFFAFIGITDVEFVRAEGIAMGPEQKETAVNGALAQAGGLRAA